jgi:hypothetical protein
VTFWSLINYLIFWFQVGPLRCWPGGLCLSRSIGDMDVGEFIVPVPHVKQVKVYHIGTGRLVHVLICLVCFLYCLVEVQMPPFCAPHCLQFLAN